MPVNFGSLPGMPRVPERSPAGPAAAPQPASPPVAAPTTHLLAQLGTASLSAGGSDFSPQDGVVAAQRFCQWEHLKTSANIAADLDLSPSQAQAFLQAAQQQSGVPPSFLRELMLDHSGWAKLQRLAGPGG